MFSAQIDILKQRQKDFHDVSDHAGRFTDLEAVSDGFMEEMVEKIIVYGEEQVEVFWRYRDEFERMSES